jgi:cell division protease FtsH
MAVVLGGRAAEEVVFGEITTGAADDIMRVTQLARSMDTECGMSDKLGPQRIAAADDAPFLGRGSTQGAATSEDTAARVDDEVGRLIDEARARAISVVETYRVTLDAVVAALLEQDTLVDDDLAAVLGTASLESPAEGTNHDGER